MRFNIAIKLADEVIRLAGAPAWEPDIGEHFADFAAYGLYAARQISPDRRPDWFSDWVRTFRTLYDDFEALRAADPMIVYQPRNPAALAFHQSLAFVRYFQAGNRTGKTQSGYAENYFCVTGVHPYRPMPPYPASTVIVSGLPFTDYTKIFDKKLLYGEDGPGGRNPLSPMFPEGGRWFYSYNKHNHTVTIACPDCAAEGKAGNCPGHHVKRTISCVSSEKGVEVIEGFTARLMHGDEHLPEEFYGAMQMRIADEPGGNLVFTVTPKQGPEAWEITKMQRLAEGPLEANRSRPGDPNSPPLVSLHRCTMWDGNVVPHDVIRKFEANLDEFERRARIDGEPAALTKNPVFDRELLAMMAKGCKEPKLGTLSSPKDLVETDDETPITFTKDEAGMLRVWEPPVPGAQYIVAVDTAKGLSKRDPSCAAVLKMSLGKDGVQFEQVAQFHGWIGIHEYTDNVFLVACWYNSALVIIELTGGYGQAVVERLKKELFYWNIFRAAGAGAYADFFQDARFGVDTTPYNKASMVAVLQQVLRQHKLAIYCAETIKELVAFEQETTDLGNPRFRGASGSHDDRVMALAIGIYTAISAQVYRMDDDVANAGKQPEAKVAA